MAARHQALPLVIAVQRGIFGPSGGAGGGLLSALLDLDDPGGGRISEPEPR